MTTTMAKAKLPISDDSEQKPNQVNIMLTDDEFAALKAYKDSRPVSGYRLATAARDALVKFLCDQGFLVRADSTP